MSNDRAEAAEQRRSIDVKKVLTAQNERDLRERRAGLPEGWAMEFLPRILPPTWQELIEYRNPEGSMFLRQDGLKVIWSASLENDGKRWVHVSCSFPDHVPAWGDLKVVKNLFVGTDRVAYQVLPPKSKYINVHPYVLHLFSPLDGDAPLPDFTDGTGSL